MGRGCPLIDTLPCCVPLEPFIYFWSSFVLFHPKSSDEYRRNRDVFAQSRLTYPSQTASSASFGPQRLSCTTYNCLPSRHTDFPHSHTHTHMYTRTHHSPEQGTASLTTVARLPTPCSPHSPARSAHMLTHILPRPLRGVHAIKFRGGYYYTA